MEYEYLSDRVKASGGSLQRLQSTIVIISPRIITLPMNERSTRFGWSESTRFVMSCTP